ncbi:hypothetical protein RMN57_13150 [Kitasatospora sp. CM 4170]|uniref:Antitoxin VbhA domain-containing protein n=1 Tax=Kitasatospora aburaviensis TaxID=67265 RepID=A0ABW1F3R3_9ACTN|nr:hypothetical protein [Kitasatospora sp. CM 4170]WNM45601.1 hypothetical protein RMN57_13150 [Kitasatospora sp. CM 4170]
MNKTEAITEAAREVLAHGGPACLTDPHIALRAMDDAMALGATEDDIKAEMRRQREGTVQ